MLKPSKNGALSGGIRTALCALALAGACAGGSIGGALIAGPLQAEAADKEDKPIILRRSPAGGSGRQRRQADHPARLQLGRVH